MSRSALLVSGAGPSVTTAGAEGAWGVSDASERAGGVVLVQALSARADKAAAQFPQQVARV